MPAYEAFHPGDPVLPSQKALALMTDPRYDNARLSAANHLTTGGIAKW
jgi:hypothetical protein